jgi:type I restriction enzyme R subunit
VERVKETRADLGALPENNVVVLERQAELAVTRDAAYWTRLGAGEIGFLRQTIAPILRAKSDADFRALRFETDVVEFGTAMVAGNPEVAEALRESIVDQVSELPLGVNLVAKERALIEAVLTPAWWTSVDHARLRDLVTRLGPLMRFRTERPQAMLVLNLADITAVHDRVSVGADGRDMPIAAYRQRVEDTVRQLLAENPVLQRLRRGGSVGTRPARAGRSAAASGPAIDEDRLRRPTTCGRSFVRLIRHVLGVEGWSAGPRS